jgi:hypothetical protein
MWRLLHEDPNPQNITASEHSPTGRMRGWSVTGSISDDNRIVFRKERQEPGETEPQVATLAGTPLELLGLLARHMFRSLIPNRSKRP